MALIASGLMQAGVATDSRSQRLTSGGASEGFPFSAADLTQIHGADRLVALVASSGVGDTFVSVRQIVSGKEMIRRPLDRHARVAFDGRHLAWSGPGGISVASIETSQEWPAWSADMGTPQAFCLSATHLFLLLPGGGGPARAAIKELSPESREPPLDRQLPAAIADAAELRCSPSGAFIWAEPAEEVFVWREGDFRLSTRAGWRPVGMTTGFLYGITPKAIARRAVAGGEWQTIHRGATGQILPALSIAADDRAVTFLERFDDGTGELVSISTVGGTPVRSSLARAGDWDRPDRWSLAGTTLLFPGQQDGRRWLFARTFPQPAADRPAPAADPGDPTARALAWLESQLGAPIVTRHGIEGRLIDSYEDDDRAGWTYDAAVAAIAFTALDRTAAAQALLAGLHHIQEADGSFAFAFHPDRVAPLIGQQYIGTMAWVVMAANFYEQRTGDGAFAPMATAALQYVDRFVVRDASSPLRGGVSMGPVAPQIYSTEHNVDAYSAFLWRGRLGGQREYLDTADQLREFIFRELATASPVADGFHFKVGHRDTTFYLDPQTWTALAFAGDEALGRAFGRALDLAEQRLLVTDGRRAGRSGLSGFRDAVHADPAKVWSEGTEGMVAARLALGDIQRARIYHEQTVRMQTASGGVPYASENTEGWSTRPSVAGTAWLLLNRTWPPSNPFLPDTAWWTSRFGDRPRMIGARPQVAPAILAPASQLPGALP